MHRAAGVEFARILERASCWSDKGSVCERGNVTFPYESIRHHLAVKLQEHQAASLHTITGYGPTWIAVNAQVTEGSLLVMPEGMLQAWRPRTWTDIAADDFMALLEARPDLVIVGTGSQQCFLHPKFAMQFANQGIGLECMATPAACRTYNILMAEGRKVLAALLPMNA
ncbi:MAG: hypothetical protein EBX66_03785 [Betaproteobacteria bacterium]|nr:hypothetical protein [Betaproteobacteria bacterium]